MKCPDCGMEMLLTENRLFTEDCVYLCLKCDNMVFRGLSAPRIPPKTLDCRCSTVPVEESTYPYGLGKEWEML